MAATRRRRVAGEGRRSPTEYGGGSGWGWHPGGGRETAVWSAGERGFAGHGKGEGRKRHSRRRRIKRMERR
jgi:hypothetical protein